MKRCEHCNVRAEGKVCPLCGETLSAYENTKKHGAYFVYRVKKELPASNANARYQALAVSMVIVAVCAFINLLTRGTEGGYWFVDIAVILGYIWVLALHTIRSKTRGSVKFFVQVGMISLMLIVFDLNAGGGLWSLVFGIPIEAVAMISLATYIVCKRKMLWNEYLLYGFMILAVGFAPMIAVEIGVVHMFWTFFMSAAYSVATFLGMLMFANKKYKETAVRRVRF